jgi:diaminopimelate epimerase
VILFSALGIGNPHMVIVVDDVNQCDLETFGPILEAHPFFPERVNVGFMQVVDRKNFTLRVFERGVGETLACGTGACAAVVAGCLLQLLDDNVLVNLPGGSLTIKWAGAGYSVTMTGPATSVFHGQITI